MSLYTVLRLHTQENFTPSEAFIRELCSKLQVSSISTASGENPDPIWKRLRKALLPRIVETAGGQSVFYERHLDVDQACRLWHDQPCHNILFSLGGEGWSARVNDECQERISSELAQEFVPWDSSISIGPWKARDYNSGNVMTSGNFSLSKSYNGCPQNLIEYQRAFASLPSVADMLRFLEQQTSSSWQVTCELT